MGKNNQKKSMGRMSHTQLLLINGLFSQATYLIPESLLQ